MLEKVMEKISFIEVMKDVAEAVARLAEYDRKISAIDKISDALLKLM